jgi:hypothetical protein
MEALSWALFGQIVLIMGWLSICINVVVSEVKKEKGVKDGWK